MGQYGWNSKIGDLLKDERCVCGIQRDPARRP